MENQPLEAVDSESTNYSTEDGWRLLQVLKAAAKHVTKFLHGRFWVYVISFVFFHRKRGKEFQRKGNAPTQPPPSAVPKVRDFNISKKTPTRRRLSRNNCCWLLRVFRPRPPKSIPFSASMWVILIHSVLMLEALVGWWWHRYSWENSPF